jgi:two-component sensor histidine kinase
MKKKYQISSRKQSLMHLKEHKKSFSAPEFQRFKRNKNLKLGGNEIINVPVNLDLLQGTESLCHDFFDNLRESLLLDPACIYLSFKETRALKATAILVVYSIIDQARETRNSRTKINIIWSRKAQRVNEFIIETGRFLRSKEREEMIDSASSLPVLMGDNSRANELSDRIVDYILDDDHYKGASAEKEQEIGSAIQETVDNVGRHAYPDTEIHENKKWWFTCDRIKDNLFIVIYDAGIGIPSSLSENNAVMLARVNQLYPDQYSGCTKESIKDDSTTNKLKALVNIKFLRKALSDEQLIRAAMHVDITSTDLDQHGQGSKSIKGLITESENSFLLMLSNYGFYRYNKGIEDNENSVSHSDFKIPGTLIQWSL